MLLVQGGRLGRRCAAWGRRGFLVAIKPVTESGMRRRCGTRREPQVEVVHIACHLCALVFSEFVLLVQFGRLGRRCAVWERRGFLVLMKTLTESGMRRRCETGREPQVKVVHGGIYEKLLVVYTRRLLTPLLPPCLSPPSSSRRISRSSSRSSSPQFSSRSSSRSSSSRSSSRSSS